MAASGKGIQLVSPQFSCAIAGCKQTEKKARGLCDSHYNKYLKLGQLDKFPRETLRVHILSEIDPNNRTAICAVCGPTKLGWNKQANGQGIWRCHKMANAASNRRHSKLQAERQELMEEFCEICGLDEYLVLDHNHTTDKCRGTLCGYCNKAIGFLNDDVELVAKALVYLRKPIPDDAPSYSRLAGFNQRASRPLRQAALTRMKLKKGA